ncbi:MAG: TolC family protein [Candidatus Omnitrophota bacterium]
MKRLLRHFAFTWIVLCAVGAGDMVPAAQEEPRHIEKGISAYPSRVEISQPELKGLDTGEPSGVITLGQALSLSIMKNPGLASYSWEVRAAEARMHQASLQPNPEFDFEAEELGWSDYRNGLGSAVMYFTFSQLLELGDKRGKRTSVAALETDIEDWEYASKRLDLFAETTKAFIKALAAWKKVALSEKFHQLAKRVFQVVSERVEAGKVSALEKTKAQVTIAGTRIELERARRQWDVTRKRLAATWGSTTPVFEGVAGDLEKISELTSLEQLLEQTARNPDQARWETEILLREAKLEFEKSKRIPNVTVSAGLQRFEQTNDNAFVFGLSIPLPIFDRNQGGIEEARHNLRKVEEEKRVADVRIKTELSSAYQILSASYLEAMTLKKDVLPAAIQVFDGLSEGYRQGKFRYLDVLDAQRTLFDAQARYIEALENYHEASVEVERLIGQKVDAAGVAKGKRGKISEKK